MKNEIRHIRRLKAGGGQREGVHVSKGGAWGTGRAGGAGRGPPRLRVCAACADERRNVLGAGGDRH